MHEWSPVATSRYQDHVIAHVEGATALGYFIIEDSACVLLDIGLIWTIYASGEMALMPQWEVISDLDIDEKIKADLLADIELLHRGETETLACMTAAPGECLIHEVKIHALGERRRIMLEGVEASLAVESSLETGEVHVKEIIRDV